MQCANPECIGLLVCYVKYLHSIILIMCVLRKTILSDLLQQGDQSN